MNRKFTLNHQLVLNRNIFLIAYIIEFEILACRIQHLLKLIPLLIEQVLREKE